MISDLKLLNILLKKPDHGLQLLMDNYMGIVYTIVHNQLNNVCSSEDIEECVSDVFLEVFNYREKINLDRGSLKGFLSVVAKRKAIDLYRKNKNQSNKNVSLDDDSSNFNAYGDDILSSLTQKERNSALINAIKSLGEPDSEIIIRKYYLRQSSKSISELLDIKPNTIDKKASRCIQKLKNLLGGVL